MLTKELFNQIFSETKIEMQSELGEENWIVPLTVMVDELDDKTRKRIYKYSAKGAYADNLIAVIFAWGFQKKGKERFLVFGEQKTYNGKGKDGIVFGEKEMYAGKEATFDRSCSVLYSDISKVEIIEDIYVRIQKKNGDEIRINAFLWNQFIGKFLNLLLKYLSGEYSKTVFGKDNFDKQEIALGEISDSNQQAQIQKTDTDKGDSENKVNTEMKNDIQKNLEFLRKLADEKKDLRKEETEIFKEEIKKDSKKSDVELQEKYGEAGIYVKFSKILEGFEGIEDDIDKHIVEIFLAINKLLDEVGDYCFNEMERDAKKGDGVAQTFMACIYATGEHVERDLEEAEKWAEMAANQKYIPGIYIIHFINLQRVLSGIKEGVANSQTQLGIMYLKGNGVIEDYSMAAYWFMKANEQNDAEAQFWIGMMYHEGNGVTQSDKEAAKWYSRAAEQEYAEAQVHLAFAYALGEGVPRDSVKAEKWAKRALDNGDESVRLSAKVLLSNL